jgi:hypothetical protein
VPVVRVETVIDAAPARVWAEVRHIERHVDWMADAEEIRFSSERREGVGTAFDCATKVGPIRLTDRMAVTAWEDGHAIGVRHTGLVTGEGRFTVEPADEGRATRFSWEERLRFPWWLAGPLGAQVGAPVLRRLWAGNLARLKAIVEAG